VTQTWTTDEMLTRIWAEIGNLDTPRNGYGGLVTLATVSADHGPELRQVVLRRADRTASMVEVFTDSTTRKIIEIRAKPQVSLLIWQPEDQLQIRLRGTASIIEGAETQPDWQTLTIAQRGNYGTVPTPGTPIDDSSDFRRVADPARLAILRISLAEIDAVHLDRPDDRRVLYRRIDDWRGQWLAP